MTFHYVSMSLKKSKNQKVHKNENRTVRIDHFFWFGVKMIRTYVYITLGIMSN